MTGFTRCSAIAADRTARAEAAGGDAAVASGAAADAETDAVAAAVAATPTSTSPTARPPEARVAAMSRRRKGSPVRGPRLVSNPFLLPACLGSDCTSCHGGVDQVIRRIGGSDLRRIWALHWSFGSPSDPARRCVWGEGSGRRDGRGGRRRFRTRRLGSISRCGPSVYETWTECRRAMKGKRRGTQLCRFSLVSVACATTPARGGGALPLL